MATPPFDISTTTPQANDNINLWPSQNQPQMDIIESWLLAISTNMGRLRGDAFDNPLDFSLTSNSASSGPLLQITRIKTPPAAADLMGRVIFRGRNSSAATVEYADLLSSIEDPVAGSEDGRLRFRVAVAGALAVRLDIVPAGVNVTGLLTAPTANIDVATFATSMTCSGTATFSNGQTVTGNVTVNGALSATTVTATSDERLKYDIETLHGALAVVNALRGVSFKHTANAMPDIGVVAQEVEKVCPAVVHTAPDGLKSVAYGNLVGLLIEAIKELTARVEELEARA